MSEKRLLTDDEVFGPANGGLLSDEQVFGRAAPAARTAPAEDTTSRTTWQATKDLAASGLQGLVGISKLPAMAMDRAVTGQWVGPGVEALSEFEASVNDQKSPYLREKERASQQRVAEAGQSVRESLGDSGVLPTAARIAAEFGVGAWEAVKDPALLASQLAQQAPMLGASRLGGLAANKLATGVAAAAPRVAATKIGQAAVAGAGTAGAVATGAGLQGADIGTDAYQRLMALPEAQWREQPEYLKLSSVIGPEAAKSKLAADKAFVAAMQAGAASMLSSALPGGASLERALVGKAAGGANPLAAVARSVRGEAIQEGVEEGYGALAANEAVRQVNPMQDLADGVGGAAGQGAALGGIMGGGSTAAALGMDSLRQRRAGAAPAAPSADVGAPGAPAPIAADELLGTAPGSGNRGELSEPSDAEKALTADPTPLAERRINALPGLPTSFTTEAGARIDGAYALVEADELQTSHDTELRPNPLYPTELQPRDRTRAASETQISSIVGKLDPARLGLSADAATGAPIVGEDGLVESGNARTIALKRIYRVPGQKAENYKTWLRENAQTFGLSPEQIDGMAAPVLVRVRSTPVNRAEFARQANASTVAAMSPLEQARSDASRIDAMDDLTPDDAGDFSTSRDFIRRFVGRLPATEQSMMIDADGRLSSSGYARVRNAVLAKAYGDSPVLTRMVESMDDNLRNVTKALMIAAPRVAQARQSIGDGRLFDADITPHLISAVEALGSIKDSGGSVADALAQTGLMGEQFSPETRELMEFLAENTRRPRRMAEFVTAYFDALEAMGDPAQGSLLGEVTPPTTGELMAAARGANDGGTNAAQDTNRRNAGEAAQNGQRTGEQPAAAPGARRGDQGNEAANEPVGPDWVMFPAESGTLGIPRAEMPQVKMKHRGALVQFLQGRGIEHEIVEVDPTTLRPTQAEFSRSKVEKSRNAEGDTATALISSDGYVLDGHHRWLSQAEKGEPVRSLRFNAPIEQLMAAVFEFPSTSRGTGATGEPSMDPRQMAVDDFKAALGALGDFLTRHQRAAIVDENTPGLMPILKDLAGAAIRMVGTSLPEIVKWVRDAMKRDPRVKPGWNKVTAAAIRKAAEQALVDLQNEPSAQLGLFDSPAAADAALQGDLFGNEPPAAKPTPAAAPRLMAMTEFNESDHLPPGLIAKAKAQVKDLQDTLPPPPTLTPEQRQQAEAALAPMLEKAAAGKAGFDKKVAAVAADAGAMGYVLAPLKSIGRAAEKLVFEARGNTASMRDLLRSTIVVSSYDEAQRVVDAIYKHFEVSKDRIKNRTNASVSAPDVDPDVVGFLPSKYGDVLVNVKFGGIEAEIQINVPEMISAKEGQGHKLYEIERGHEKGSETARLVQAAQVEYYAAASAAALRRQAASDKTIGSSEGGQPSDLESSPPTKSKGPSPGMNTESRPVSRSKNSEPAGNLSGTFTASPSGSIVPPQGSQEYTESKKGASDVGSESRDRTGLEGQGPGPARKSAGQRRVAQVRNEPGSGDLLSVGGSDDGAAPQGGLGQAGTAGVRSEDADGGSPQSRGTAGRGAGVPAGRDIAPKSGLNYRFSDDDISPPGSWAKRAAANVDAVELVKKLQAEGRKATREEQAVLARFVGWGASEIANNIFGTKLDKAEEAIGHYEQAVAAFEKRDNAPMRKDPYGGWRGTPEGWHPAVMVMIAANPDKTYYSFNEITREQLDKAAPPKDTRRWLDLRKRLKAAMTEEEWAEASRTTQYGHYTSAGIVRGMWGALERFGFKGGAILEPGAGKGNFPGLMPESMAINSLYTGIEYDSITGAILSNLLPDERILVESFVDSKLPKNFFDVAIGNPPFSGTPILADTEYKRHAFKLHDYFFAKTIDRVKPGGLVMFVTSRYTMDKAGDKARQYMAERADLVGAIRLPQTAFKANAGTEVVTDVLFLRKKVPGETFEGGQAWLKAVPIKTSDGGDAIVNEYFAAHPEMVLGKSALAGSMYSKNEYTVLPPEGDIEALFAKAVESMPAGIYKAARGSAAEAAQVREIDFNPKAQKEGNYYVNDKGVLMQREGGVGQAVIGKSAKDTEIIKAFVPLRDALKQAHFDQLNDGDWGPSLKTLQAAYDTFVAAHGQVNQFTEKTVKVKVDELDEDGNPTGSKVDDEEIRRSYPLLKKIEDDPDWTLVAALEKVNDETGEITRSPFLTARVLGKPEAAKISTPTDALLAVLNDVGRVDIPSIAHRIGIPEADAIEALGSTIYNDPEGSWVTSDEYLSGNVKAKLEAARAAAKADRRFDRNVAALEAAQPAPKSPAQISASLGMNWIPGSDYSDFLKETAGVTAEVRWNDATRQWIVRAISGYSTPKATADWGTPSRHAADLLEHGLTGRPVKIMKSVGTGKDAKQVFDESSTEAANDKLAKLKDEFEAWVWRDADRSNRLVQVYNEKFNTTVPRAFDGRHLTLPGASKQFSIFDHVKRGAWRIIQSGNTYLAHAVGSGKTFQMVISAMEQKRLGLIRKPMVVVPNHMLQQFAREWQELYPAARLMIADENNFHTDNRRRFVSRVALSDLDGVIITHSAFKLLDIDPEFKSKIIEEQLDYLRAALEEAGGNVDDLRSAGGFGARKKSGSRDPKVKQIERQIENLEQKLEAALSSEGKDKNVRFDQLGVDFLYVDEAHEFRKLDFGTSRQVKGIQPAGSARALDLYIKSRYLEEKTPGRSLVMASGTPVTNTLAELYTVSRFMGRQAMIDRGIEDFDSWAAMFGRERTALEPNAAGKYEPVTRFSKFVNVPELTQMFREFADVVTSDQLAALLGDKRPKVEGGSRRIVVTPKTEAYTAYQKALAARVEASRKWKPSKEEPNNPDPIIRIIGDGRLAAIDMRFVDPAAPSDPRSKLNTMIDDVIRTFKETADMEYTDKAGNVEPNKGASMMVFSDLGFGAGVAASRGFNARAWFEKRLRDAGVPPGKVAFMSDYKKSTDKLKLFKDVNAGRVRLLIGSSKNMGTGVNAQQRLKAMFHLDSPWYPADLEQREGRIVRQGNKNKLVQISAYAAKGTYDENMWKMLASKQYFIDQALNGDENLREVEDLDSQSQFDMAAAMVADDPRVMQLAGARAEIEKLGRLFRAHEDQRMGFRREYAWSADTIAINEKLMPEAEAMAAKAVDLSGTNFRAKVGKASFDERAAWGEALLAKFKELTDKMEDSQQIGEISGFRINLIARRGADNYNARLQLDLPEPALLVTYGNESPIGIAMRAQNAVADLARVPARMREIISGARARMDALRERLDTPFPMAGMLADKIKEASALEAELEAAGKPRAWRVERIATGLGHEVQAASADEAIDKAVSTNGGLPGEWRAIEVGAAPAAVEPELDADEATALAAAGMIPPVYLSRGPGGGIDLPALKSVAARAKAALPGLPRVHVLASPADAPADLRDFIARRGATADAEGALHGGEIYLFASGIRDAGRAEHVLAEHEAAHFGLRGILGSALKQTMQAIYNQNASVRRAATPLLAQKMSLAEAVEEVIVEIPSAQLARLKGWRMLVGKARDALKARGFTGLAAQIDAWLAGHLTEQQRADLFVADLVREARAYVARRRADSPAADTTLSTGRLADDAAAQESWLTQKAKEAGYADIEALLEGDYPLFERLAAEWRQLNPAEALLSRSATAAPAQGDAAQRAEAIIQTAAGIPKPLDSIARTLTRITGLERLTTTIYGQGARLIDRLVPERVKAGVVSDYGVPEAVIDQRARMQGVQREQLRQAGKLIDKLATLTRAESRVAYEWMSGDDTRTADEIMADLPQESVEVLREVRNLIDTLSREAVRLGQLPADAFERHRFAYLRRSYFKHAQELTGQEKTARQRAISILGDQYKGRGMTANAAMKQIQNVAPEWWQRKVVAGKADTSLKGQKFERLERRAATGAGVDQLEGMGENTRPGKLLEIHYWPAGEPKPAKYADWESAGTWEVRDTKGGDLIVWRDFTKDERVKMGEIDEARYAIGKTLHRMIHDIEVGRYLEWLAQGYAKKPGEEFAGSIVEASEHYKDAFKPGEWVQVPDTSIPGTSAKKYGKLAGLYLPGPIWNDLRQVVGGRFMPLGETYQELLRMWKISKTALSPAVHTNNVMSNFVMADWHDVSAGHVAKSLRIILAARTGEGRGALGRAANAVGRLGVADREAAQEILTRYENSGGSIGGWVTQEIANEQLAPIVEALQKELADTAAAAAPAEIGVYSALQHALHARFPQAWEAFKASRPAAAVATDAQNLIDLYQAEDDVFRLAAWLKAKEGGMADAEAGKVARRSFLDYSINAPWVQALRSTALPFISFTYRAVPMLLETAGKRPHKILKLMMIAGALNALGVMLAGGDDGDDERKLLPEEKAGGLWGLVPKLIRLPWNDAYGSPVYLDVRRWVPVGDVFDLGQGHAALPVPPSLMPGGPLVVLLELVPFNTSVFTGKKITLETDTAGEKTAKVLDHLYKAFAPNLPIPGPGYFVPGVDSGQLQTYSWTAIIGAAQGRTDAFGRELSTGQAVASAFGVKAASYPTDVLRRNIVAKRNAEVNEIDMQISALRRQRMTNRIDQDEYEAEVRRQQEKKRKVMEEAAAKLN